MSKSCLKKDEEEKNQGEMDEESQENILEKGVWLLREEWETEKREITKQ
uniref:Uncharacterized protein n=1 Tax=Mustela putorius furo TaxID=9669 RepID=M3XPU0_MUSPF